jgi:tRNA-specific 2-thiouridylase
MPKSKKTVAVGLSGGVDSSVAAALLQESGYTVLGVSMMIFDGSLALTEDVKHACFGPGEQEDIAAAESVCEKLGIPFHTIDLRKEYQHHVIDHFRNEYLAGKTPNPCIVCNRRLKFGFLLERAKKSGLTFDSFATGHYARVEKSGDRCLLKKALDKSKDQSYFLYALSLEQLAHTLFPLGEFKKHQVREMARSLGLKTADRPESQDFIAGGDYSLLFNPKEVKEGNIVDECGNVLGKHQGIVHYTIGQRRGLGIPAQRPLYVTQIDAAGNTIVVSDKEKLASNGLIADDINLIAIDKLDRPYPVKVKIRLNQKAVDATVYPYQNGQIKILFDKPQLSVCPGQHAVFYSEDVVVGGGVIVEAV